MRGLTRNLSKTFIRIMILLGTFGVGLWLLGKIIALSGRTTVTQPVASVASRYRSFATTGL